MSRNRDFWRSSYTAQPRRADAGIKARSKRGSFGDKWWTKRWVECLETYGAATRLSRGRNYARMGQVLDITVKPGEVTAKVQGSRVRPYRVTIKMKTLSEAQWTKIGARIARRPLLGAKLLAGEMPPEMDSLFEEAKLSLFPSARRDFSTDCSCPDWENPCKHIAAVYYLLGEEFDRDPFLIFRLRGIERRELAGLVVAGAETEKVAPAGAGKRTSGARKKRAGGEDPGPDYGLPADPEAFWGAPAAGEARDATWDARVPLVPAVLPKRLGSFPFWRGREDFLSAMEDIYRRASEAGLRAFLGGAHDRLGGAQDRLGVAQDRLAREPEGAEQ